MSRPRPLAAPDMALGRTGTVAALGNDRTAMKIRSATRDDAEAIAAIYAPIVLETTISFEWVPPSADDFRARIVKTLAKYPWLVATDASDRVAGYVYASNHREPPSYQWSVTTSVFVREDSRG